LAIALASDAGYGGTRTFGGQTVNATDTLVMYTWTGDTNLDGNINADDYFAIDSNYNKFFNSDKTLNVGLTYGKGDFNYDGVIDGDDYALIDAAFSAQSAVPGGSLAGLSAVPEPATAGFLSLVSLFAMARRRRS
jgi:hypothetical protein